MKNEKIVEAADFIAKRFSSTNFAYGYKKQKEFESEEWYINQLKNDLETCIISEFLYIGTGEVASAVKMVGNILNIIDVYFTKLENAGKSSWDIVKERDNKLLGCLYNKKEVSAYDAYYPENCGLLELILSMLNKYEFVTYGFSITGSSLHLTSFGKTVRDILLED